MQFLKHPAEEQMLQELSPQRADFPETREAEETFAEIPGIGTCPCCRVSRCWALSCIHSAKQQERAKMCMWVGQGTAHTTKRSSMVGAIQRSLWLICVKTRLTCAPDPAESLPDRRGLKEPEESSLDCGGSPEPLALGGRLFPILVSYLCAHFMGCFVSVWPLQVRAS